MAGEEVESDAPDSRRHKLLIELGGILRKRPVVPWDDVPTGHSGAEIPDIKERVASSRVARRADQVSLVRLEIGRTGVVHQAEREDDSDHWWPQSRH